MRTGSAPRAAPAVRHARHRTVLARDACMRPGHAKSRAAARRRPAAPYHVIFWIFLLGGRPSTSSDQAYDHDGRRC